MATIRVQKTREYFSIQNRIVTDLSLSSDGFRVLTYLLSKKDGWIVFNADIQKTFNFTQYQLNKCLSNIKSAGYLIRDKKHINGRWEWESIIFEEPNTIPRISTDCISNACNPSDIINTEPNQILNIINKKINKKDLKISIEEKLRINLDELKILKTQKIEQALEAPSNFDSYKKSQGQVWDKNKAIGCLNQIFTAMETWMIENPKRLSEKPNLQSRFDMFANNKDIGWIYPAFKTQGYTSNEPMNTTTQIVEAQKRDEQRVRLQNLNEIPAIDTKTSQNQEMSKDLTEYTEEGIKRHNQLIKELELEVELEHKFEKVPEEELETLLSDYLVEFIPKQLDIRTKAKEKGLTLLAYAKTQRGMFSMFRNHIKSKF